MKVSKHSWHYRLHTWTYGKVYAKSICSYFWVIVSALALSPFILLGRAMGEKWSGRLVVGIAVIWGTFLVGIFEYLFFYVAWLLWNWVGVLAVIGGHGLFILGVWGLTKFYEWWEWRKEGKPPKPKEPSLLYEYLKAKKRRVCPLLEWVE